MATAVEQRTHEAIQDINRKFDVTLRDLFAMSAMNALLQKPFGCIEGVAEQSYRIANAMLKVRKK